MINWNPNQPNNVNGIEDCGNILVDFIKSPQPVMLTDGPGAISAKTQFARLDDDMISSEFELIYWSTQNTIKIYCAKFKMWLRSLKRGIILFAIIGEHSWKNIVVRKNKQ
jgi:hypothetical protein